MGLLLQSCLEGSDLLPFLPGFNLAGPRLVSLEPTEAIELGGFSGPETAAIGHGSNIARVRPKTSPTPTIAT